MGRTPDLERHALWRDHIRRQEASGLTIANFCSQQRIAVSAFHAWKRRFRLMEAQVPIPFVPAPPAFLPVTVCLSESSAGQPPPIEADLPNGIRLRIPTADARLACHLVRAIAKARTHAGGSK